MTTRAALIVVASLLVASCASLPDTYPELDETRTTDAVAAVRFGTGAHLRQFPECSEPDVICMDPPPFRLRARVVAQLYGPPLPRTLWFASTSHYGIPRHDAGRLQLVHLVSDGDTHVMPRYHRDEVGRDASGELMMPVYPHEIPWLPCGTHAIRVEADFRMPRDRFSEPASPYLLEQAKEHPEFYIADRTHVRPRYGIRMDDLAKFLSDRQPSGRDAFQCHTGSHAD